MESRSQTMTSPRSQSVLDGATREQTNTSLAWSPVPSPLLNSDFASDVDATSSNESDTEMIPAKELSSSDLQSSNNLFLKILYKILRKPPSKKEQETHEEIKRKLHPKKRIAAECLEEYSQSRGGDFILKEAKNATTSVHDFGVCVSQDWPSVKFLREKEGLMFVLSLTAKDFDGAGDLNFPKAKKSLCTKGGIEYYLPNSDWIRIGLKCRGRYDYGTDNWLEEKNPLEWTVGFHASHQAGTASVCQNREFLTEGPGQVHKNDIDVNELSDLKGGAF
ncbi:uncharacterized protein LOC134839668 [Symsagittifera roscoffensis]|uniref:uncharacterized protein LOC134839668 n=1 Tax=Symsagittifera roscoffensis TaxID=84072 RepID=UPI00307CA49A